MPDAVMAATEIEPMARCRTAAINQANRIVSRTGVPTSAEKNPPRMSWSPVSVITAPKEPQGP